MKLGLRNLKFQDIEGSRNWDSTLCFLSSVICLFSYYKRVQ